MTFHGYKNKKITQPSMKYEICTCAAIVTTSILIYYTVELVKNDSTKSKPGSNLIDPKNKGDNVFYQDEPSKEKEDGGHINETVTNSKKDKCGGTKNTTITGERVCDQSGENLPHFVFSTNKAYQSSDEEPHKQLIVEIAVKENGISAKLSAGGNKMLEVQSEIKNSKADTNINNLMSSSDDPESVPQPKPDNGIFIPHDPKDSHCVQPTSSVQKMISKNLTSNENHLNKGLDNLSGILNDQRPLLDDSVPNSSYQKENPNDPKRNPDILMPVAVDLEVISDGLKQNSNSQIPTPDPPSLISNEYTAVEHHCQTTPCDLSKTPETQKFIPKPPIPNENTLLFSSDNVIQNPDGPEVISAHHIPTSNDQKLMFDAPKLIHEDSKPEPNTQAPIFNNLNLCSSGSLPSTSGPMEVSGEIIPTEDLNEPNSNSPSLIINDTVSDSKPPIPTNSSSLPILSNDETFGASKDNTGSNQENDSDTSLKKTLLLSPSCHDENTAEPDNVNPPKPDNVNVLETVLNNPSEQDVESIAVSNGEKNSTIKYVSSRIISFVKSLASDPNIVGPSGSTDSLEDTNQSPNNQNEEVATAKRLKSPKKKKSSKNPFINDLHDISAEDSTDGVEKHNSCIDNPFLILQPKLDNKFGEHLNLPTKNLNTTKKNHKREHTAPHNKKFLSSGLSNVQCEDDNIRFLVNDLSNKENMEEDCIQSKNGMKKTTEQEKTLHQKNSGSSADIKLNLSISTQIVNSADNIIEQLRNKENKNKTESETHVPTGFNDSCKLPQRPLNSDTPAKCSDSKPIIEISLDDTQMLKILSCELKYRPVETNQSIVEANNVESFKPSKSDESGISEKNVLIEENQESGGSKVQANTTSTYGSVSDNETKEIILDQDSHENTNIKTTTYFTFEKFNVSAYPPDYNEGPKNEPGKPNSNEESHDPITASDLKDDCSRDTTDHQTCFDVFSLIIPSGDSSENTSIGCLYSSKLNFNQGCDCSNCVKMKVANCATKHGVSYADGIKACKLISNSNILKDQMCNPTDSGYMPNYENSGVDVNKGNLGIKTVVSSNDLLTKSVSESTYVANEIECKRDAFVEGSEEAKEKYQMPEICESVNDIRESENNRVKTEVNINLEIDEQFGVLDKHHDQSEVVLRTSEASSVDLKTNEDDQIIHKQINQLKADSNSSKYTIGEDKSVVDNGTSQSVNKSKVDLTAEFQSEAFTNQSENIDAVNKLSENHNRAHLNILMSKKLYKTDLPNTTSKNSSIRTVEDHDQSISMIKTDALDKNTGDTSKILFPNNKISKSTEVLGVESDNQSVIQKRSNSTVVCIPSDFNNQPSATIHSLPNILSRLLRDPKLSLIDILRNHNFLLKVVVCDNLDNEPTILKFIQNQENASKTFNLEVLKINNTLYCKTSITNQNFNNRAITNHEQNSLSTIEDFDGLNTFDFSIPANQVLGRRFYGSHLTVPADDIQPKKVLPLHKQLETLADSIFDRVKPKCGDEKINVIILELKNVNMSQMRKFQINDLFNSLMAYNGHFCNVDTSVYVQKPSSAQSLISQILAKDFNNFLIYEDQQYKSLLSNISSSEINITRVSLEYDPTLPKSPQKMKKNSCKVSTSFELLMLRAFYNETYNLQNMFNVGKDSLTMLFLDKKHLELVASKLKLRTTSFKLAVNHKKSPRKSTSSPGRWITSSIKSPEKSNSSPRRWSTSPRKSAEETTRSPRRWSASPRKSQIIRHSLSPGTSSFHYQVNYLYMKCITDLHAIGIPFNANCFFVSFPSNHNKIFGIQEVPARLIDTVNPIMFRKLIMLVTCSILDNMNKCTDEFGKNIILLSFFKFIRVLFVNCVSELTDNRYLGNSSTSTSINILRINPLNFNKAISKHAAQFANLDRCIQKDRVGCLNILRCDEYNSRILSGEFLEKYLVETILCDDEVFNKLNECNNVAVTVLNHICCYFYDHVFSIRSIQLN